MRMILRVLDGNQAGSTIRVSGPKFLVGRDVDCQLRPTSDLISRHHCALIIEQGYMAVRDFGSKNGTFVNGKPVTGECELKAGDELLIGPLRFEVQVDHAVGGPKRPKVKDVKEAVARTAEMAAGDLDIADWLSDDRDEAVSGTETHGMKVGNRDTGETVAGDTSIVRMDKDATLPLKPTDSTSLPSAQDVLQQSKDDSKPKDTHSAAMNVLRQLRQQQREKHQEKK